MSNIMKYWFRYEVNRVINLTDGFDFVGNCLRYMKVWKYKVLIKAEVIYIERIPKKKHLCSHF